MATIFDSIQAGDVEAVRAALAEDKGAASARNDEGVSAVRAALYAHKQDVADVILEAEPELDVFDAASVGDVDRLAELLDGDADLVNAYSEDGYTPLHFAAYFSQGDAARALLDRGADVGAVSKNDMEVQPLHSAVAAQARQVVAALLLAGADVNARQKGGFTPLMGAEQHEDEEMVRLLMDHGAQESATPPSE